MGQHTFEYHGDKDKTEQAWKYPQASVVVETNNCDDQIRQQATLIGNIVNASPAADGTPPVLAMDGRVEIASLENGNVDGFQKIKIFKSFEIVNSPEMVGRV